MSIKTVVQGIYNPSPLQEGILFHSLMDNTTKAYLIQMVLRIKGNLDVEILEDSINSIIERYDILRTNFVFETVKKPQQVVLKERAFRVNFKDISNLPEDEKDPYIQRFIEEDSNRRFNLSTDILVRAAVIQRDQEAFLIILDFHHILIDGWSTAIIAREVFTAYRALRNGIKPDTQTLYPYSDYIGWLEKQDKEKALLYWKEYIKGCEAETLLPTYKDKVNNSRYQHEITEFKLDKKLTAKLEEIAEQSMVTVNTVFQAIWGIVLQRYNNSR
ncbi:condensation domain-containing protein, partial [Ruminiclostridium cellobioparum]|uniref:condensation domain-containing protein n=1 Tax=Ruminiclostridium cellobioparum TaxID=29355 RepID=UPI0005513040